MADRLTLPPPLALAHRLVARALRPGAIALDGTVGNGHDTRFLAERVGPTGLVLGMDVQASAISQTRQRLEEGGLTTRVRLFQEGHERLAARLFQEGHERLAARLAAESVPVLHAAMFNLGYLPGSDKDLITRPETTLPALAAALGHLTPGGTLSVMLYRGHPGGAEESEAVLAWARALARDTARAYHYQALQSPHAPTLLLVERRAPGPRE